MSSKATIFEFTSYKLDPDKKRVFFRYKTYFSDESRLSFTETITLPKPLSKRIDKELLKKLLQSLHIILGISYYKLYCATNVKLPYKLFKEESDFWNTIYKNGLGEFFYKNNLDPKISPKFPFIKNAKTTQPTGQAGNYSLPTTNSKYLVGIGGGKDSIVSIELLKDLPRQAGRHADVTGFLVQTNENSEIADKIAKLANINLLKIKRILDPKVLNPHKYSGHIPVSAIYAFLGELAAVLYGYSYVVVGNEYSSNFGNVEYKGLTINHQWSKSFEFENLFRDYCDSFITKDIKYFSILRPLYELRIAKLFSKQKKYFNAFSSCNRNFKIIERSKKLWCNNCAKCVFTFTTLSAFLDKEDLINIFKENLYQKQNLLPLFKDILGFGQMKPFDCVGTFEESQTALFMASEKFKEDFIIRQLLPLVKHSGQVLKMQKETNIPEQLRLLPAEKILILGYGKEGQITEKYIRKYYPVKIIKIADEKLNKDYLENINNYDIIIKSPGIPKEKLMVKTRAPESGTRPSTINSALVPYTTATNIFLSEVKDKNIIVGVTGSKGKSTTSSLIFNILKTAKKDVELLGNIGNPMLERLLTPVKKGKIFILELSSYQLDDIKFSPDIAVVTNLFKEHMDYHGNYENYYKAKKNIINFQDKDGFFVYNPENKLSLSWAKDYNGNKIPFSKNIPLKESDIPLIGKHNQDNIASAVAVAKIFKISDKIIASAIKKFRGLPHRLELVGEFGGIKFYDDAISTTPESTIEAIKALKNVNTIFLGGQDRGYDFLQLEKTIKKYKIKNIVLFPDSGSRIISNKKSFNILETRSMEEAVKFAYQNTKRGGVCLLSCASPSYSLWKNFEEKGDEFKYFIKKLSK